MSKAVLVKKSGIEGKGVFAGRNFKKGEIVLKWDVSHELTPKQFKELPQGKKKYVTCLKGRYILMQPPEKYVNHSCEANTSASNFCDIARRAIKKGEEITANYSETGALEPMKCNCGSIRCKGIIKN